MLSIYICDSSARQAEFYCQLVNQFLLFKDWDIQKAAAYTSPAGLLRDCQINTDAGLYFLDIEPKTKMDGLQLAKAIRRKDPRGFIVFLTNHPQYAPLAFQYHVEALDYILKSETDTLRQRIEKCITDAYDRYQRDTSESQHYIVIKTGPYEKTIPKKDILYITTDAPHHLKIRTVSFTLGIYGKLKEFENKLQPDFIRIHKNCLVNSRHIVETDSKNHLLRLSDNSVLTISTRKTAAVKRSFPSSS